MPKAISIPMTAIHQMSNKTVSMIGRKMLGPVHRLAGIVLLIANP
jgi:hypothetical protein